MTLDDIVPLTEIGGGHFRLTKPSSVNQFTDLNSFITQLELLKLAFREIPTAMKYVN